MDYALCYIYVVDFNHPLGTFLRNALNL